MGQNGRTAFASGKPRASEPETRSEEVLREVHQETALPVPMVGGILANRVAIVTGGGRGIGRAIGEALATAGAAVALVGRSGDTLFDAVTSIERAGGRAIPIVSNVTDPVAVVRMVREVRESLGAPDVLVNNAGSLAAIGPTWEIEPDRWWSDVEVNLRSAALCSWAVLPEMIERGSGTIINLASTAGTSKSGYDSAYSAAKAALIRLTSSLASESAPHGIRAFAIHPGTVRTALTRQLLESAEGRRHFPFFQRLRPDQWSDPSRIAQLCVTLAAGRGGRLSGYFIDTADSPSKLVWRTLGALGVAWRDLYAMYLCRAPSPRQAARDGVALRQDPVDRLPMRP